MNIKEGDDSQGPEDRDGRDRGGGWERRRIKQSRRTGRAVWVRFQGMSWIFQVNKGGQSIGSRGSNMSKGTEIRKQHFQGLEERSFPYRSGDEDTGDVASKTKASGLHWRWTWNTSFWESVLSGTLLTPSLVWGYCFRYTLKEFVNGVGNSLKQQWEGRGGNAVNILSVCFYLARNFLFS